MIFIACLVLEWLHVFLYERSLYEAEKAKMLRKPQPSISNVHFFTCQNRYDLILTTNIKDGEGNMF